MAEVNVSQDESEAVFCQLQAFAKNGQRWSTAKMLLTALHWPSRYDRKLRLIAAGSRGEIVSAPGCKGYALATVISCDEIMEAANRHQAQELHHRQRRLDLLNRLHKGTPARPV
jgi:hypothetical protein